MLKRVKIIVLKAFPFRESDLIVKGLSSDGLQMNFIAKGALKSKKRFAGGVLEPSSFIEAEYQPSSQSLHHLRQAWMLEDFHDLRKDYDRLQMAFYILKTAGALSLEGEEGDSKELFSLVGNALLETQRSPRLDTLKLFFQIKLLFLQGVLPQNLSRQEILNKTLKDHHSFNMNEEEQKKISEQVDQALNHYLHL
ncbi:MAG: DNA repair protein RecO [Bdellovibrionales bacterium]|nr:DNA repair protein RecO [Bdellovibrionales bacterium]